MHKIPTEFRPPQTDTTHA